MYVTAKYIQIHTDMHCEIQSDTVRYSQICTAFKIAYVHVFMTKIHTHALPLSNAYVYVCTVKYTQIQPDTYRYALLSKMHMCMYS
jgi:hypothetical protein